MNETQRRTEFLSLVRNRMDPALRGTDYDRCFNSVRAERPDLLDNRAEPTLAIANSFDPSQPRDEQGRWALMGAAHVKDGKIFAHMTTFGKGDPYDQNDYAVVEITKDRFAKHPQKSPTPEDAHSFSLPQALHLALTGGGINGVAKTNVTEELWTEINDKLKTQKSRMAF